MYAFHLDIARPIKDYDEMSAEVERRLGQPLADDCLLHLVTTTADGFRITEVWTSHEACDRFGDEVRRPVAEALRGPNDDSQQRPENQELAVHRALVNAKAAVSS